MKVSMQVSDSLTANLAKLPSAVNRTAQVAALRAGAEPMRADAQSRAPYDPDAGAPHLQDSILVTVPTETQLAALGDETAVVLVGPSTSTFWGLFQEFGYGPGPAQPFLRPAFDTQNKTSLGIVQSKLWASIRGFLGMSQTTGGRFT